MISPPVRAHSLLFTFLFTTMLYSLSVLNNTASATLTCASRHLVKQNLTQFINRASENLPKDLVDKTKRIIPDRGKVAPEDRTIFGIKAKEFYENSFQPRDIVCIADENETPMTIKERGVLDTFSGTTVLLAPFEVDFEGGEF